MGSPGLDSVWIMPDGMAHPVFDHTMCLFGDFSDRRWTTFRGERYTKFIERVSGITLRQATMTNDDVTTIADALEQYTITKQDLQIIAVCELIDLRLMFRRYGECGATLVGFGGINHDV